MKIAVAALLLAFVGTSHAAQRDESAQPLKAGATLTARNAVSRPEADTLIFDSFTGASYTSTGSSPRTFMGMGFNMANGGGTNPVISRITVYMASTAVATYTNIRANIQLWDTYSQVADPVFSNAAGAQIAVDLGP